MWIVDLQGILPVPGMRTLKGDSLSLMGWNNMTKKPRQSLGFVVLFTFKYGICSLLGLHCPV